MTEKEIENIAHLSRMSLTNEDCHQFVGKISHILDSFAVIQSIDVDDEVELVSPKNREDLRVDESFGGTGQDLALENAPQKHEGHFRVPAVL